MVVQCRQPKPVCKPFKEPEIDSQSSGPVRQPYLTYLPARARICKRLWSPGIDSEESISLAYVAWRAGTKIGLSYRPASRNRFRVSLKGLQIRALAT
jgi:hypothetical protein